MLTYPALGDRQAQITEEDLKVLERNLQLNNALVDFYGRQVETPSSVLFSIRVRAPKLVQVLVSFSVASRTAGLPLNQEAQGAVPSRVKGLDNPVLNQKQMSTGCLLPG